MQEEENSSTFTGAANGDDETQNIRPEEEKESIKPETEEPDMIIKSIDRFGVVDVSITDLQRQQLPENATDVNETVLYVAIESENVDYYNNRMLEFSWFIRSISDDSLSLQLVWDHPLYVSQNPIRDRLLVALIDRTKRRNLTDTMEVDLANVNLTDTAYGIIPPQVIPGDETNALVEVTAVVSVLLSAIIFGRIVLYPILRLKLGLIWAIINMLQFISFYILIDALMPGNMGIALEACFKVSTFTIIPIEYITDPIKNNLQS